jgi:hypothetical protein
MTRLEFICPRCGKSIFGGAESSDPTGDEPGERVTLECDTLHGGCGWKLSSSDEGHSVTSSQQVEAVEGIEKARRKPVARALELSNW